MGVKLSFPLDGDVSGAQLPANYAPYSIFHAFDNYLAYMLLSLSLAIGVILHQLR